MQDFDTLGAIANWVEKDQAPERLVATAAKTHPGVTRPLCPYPTYARYNGTGDPKSADSYQCIP